MSLFRDMKWKDRHGKWDVVEIAVDIIITTLFIVVISAAILVA